MVGLVFLLLFVCLIMACGHIGDRRLDRELENDARLARENPREFMNRCWRDLE